MFNMMKTFIMIALASLTLVACGPNVDILGGYLTNIDDPQNQAGLVAVNYKFCENPNGAYEICGANMVDGKEQSVVDLDWNVNQEGVLNIEYNATDTRAFQAFATRAELQARLGESLGNEVFDALQKIVNPASAAVPDISAPD